MDKNEIITILKDWNFWESEPKETFARDFYDEQIIKKSSAKEILFVKGIRRSGKSTLLINYIKHLLKSGVEKERILFVNLEDPRFATNLSLSLLEEIKSAYLYYLNPSSKPYIFLDEVQNIENFEKWLLKEYELDTAHLFATGSNSKLLSSEIGSSLSGRYLDVLVYPLSFKEYLSFKKIDISTPYQLISHKSLVEKEFEEFLSFGGFPKVVLTEDKELKRAELKSYFDSILLRDIVARYNLDNFRVLEKLAIYLLSSISNPISINKIKNHLNISYDMANRYFEYLQNAFIIDALPLFDWSYKKQLVNPKKIYSIDLGLTKRVSFEVGKKMGDYLENLVFLELKRRYNEIFYYKTSQNYKVDFLIKDANLITHLIQVSYSIKDKKTLDREIRALLKAKNELVSNNPTELLLITYDDSREITVDDVDIKVVNIFEWLLLEVI
ncbi:MAG: ATP-binding protein [Epsilonproteobacteria bacterium]|nr:ATP-binding protein [Campylobacterota bacterium]